MKKILTVLVLGVVSTVMFAQKGDITVGALGGYDLKHKQALYGLNLSYGLNQMMEVSLSGLYGGNLTEKDEFVTDGKWKAKFYSANLDARFLILNFDVLATGPAIGGQYLSAKYYDSPIVNNTQLDPSLRDFNAFGFNIGWHVRANITDNVKVNAGWRYTSAKESASYNMFYLGLGYTFSLF